MKHTKGLGIETPFFSLDYYKEAFHMDEYTDVKEEGYKIDILWFFEKDYKRTTFYDNRGFYYREIETQNEENVSQKINISFHFIIGIDIDFNIDDIIK